MELVDRAYCLFSDDDEGGDSPRERLDKQYTMVTLNPPLEKNKKLCMNSHEALTRHSRCGGASAAERRGNNLKGVDDFHPEAKARIY